MDVACSASRNWRRRGGIDVYRRVRRAGGMPHDPVLMEPFMRVSTNLEYVRDNNASTSNRPRLPLMAIALLALGMLSSAPAQAFIYTVGKSGLSNNCSFPTVQQALTAAARNPGPDEIWITRDVNGGYYQNQALVSAYQDVKLVGGFDDCWDTTLDGITELHGNGGSAAPVLTINGGTVIIEKLRFTRGDATGSASTTGGGIRFAGRGQLSISDSLIDRNAAGMGGGIAIVAQGGDVALHLGNTRVIENHATTVGGGILLMSAAGVAALTAWDDVDISVNAALEGGGGIAMNPRSMLTMNGHRLRVEANSSIGDGGAVLAVSPVVIHAAPSASHGGSTFRSNEARNGGVLALTDHPRLGTSSGRSVVTLTSKDALNPNWMSANRATQRGAVVYVRRTQAPLHGDDVSNVCTWNAAFTGNRADVGGSVVSIVGAGARFQNEPACSSNPYPCSTIDVCNEADGNTTAPGEVFGSESSLYEALDGSVMSLRDMKFRSNRVRSIFRARHADGTPFSILGVSQALVVQNVMNTLLDQREGSYFELSSATVADNQVLSQVFGNAIYNFFLRDSIVDQPEKYLFSVDPLQFGGDDVTNLLYSGIYFGSGDTLEFGSPAFTQDSTYRQMPWSPGIDFAPSAGGADIHGRPRTVDIAAEADSHGPRDLGAVETQVDAGGMPET